MTQYGTAAASRPPATFGGTMGDRPGTEGLERLR